MTPATLAIRGLRYFWRTNLAVALGVGVAVSALAGALIVGESVRASLRALALSRLGRTAAIVTATNLFTEPLAHRVSSAAAFTSRWTGSVPVFALEGIVIHSSNGRRAGGVQVFGVDDRFWQFHGVNGVSGPAGRDAFVSTALARELGMAAGDALVIRIQTPSTIPAGVIQGRRDEPGRALRVTGSRVLSRIEMGDFSPRPQQGDARTVFVPLDRLQRDLELPHRINMLLVGGGTSDGRDIQRVVEQHVDLADLGVRVRPLRDKVFTIESETGFLSDAMAKGITDAARDIGVEPIPVLTYLATSINANGRETPYSLVSALPENAIRATGASGETGATGRAPVTPVAPVAPVTPVAPVAPAIWLSQWTADDLGAHAGDAVTLHYYLWSDTDGLTPSSSSFVVAGVLPMTGLAVDQDLTPEYPGVSTSADMADWDPPFPVDLRKVRKKDEDYWDKYRTAPKAFVRIEDGQALWHSTYGKVTSIRLPAGDREMTALHGAIDKALPPHLPASLGQFHALPIQRDALAAAAGTTDFGEYFTYFSFFVVVASLLLTVLFFRLGIEQRASEIGVLGALGYSPAAITRILLAEGIVVAAIGAVVGIAGALGYSALMMLGLRTWWIGAVGTTALQVHPSAASLGIGVAGGLIAAVVCILWSLRVLRRSSARQLMSGGWLDTAGGLSRSTHLRVVAGAGAVLALLLVAASALEWIPAAAGFFGSGTLLLIAALCALAAWLRSTSATAFATRRWPLLRFGVRNARYRPARSVLSTALIASAIFLIVSVGAFRQDASDLSAPDSGSGGYPLIAESLVPLMHDPSTPAGHEALNLGTGLEGLRVARFRLRPGDDASCLNLYQPRNPRLLGATDAFIKSGRFAFSASLAGNDAEGRNPWLLLNKRFGDGAVPVIGDATSLAYAFHLAVGDDFVMDGPDGRPLRLRIVGALTDSVLQSELIMNEAAFTRLFPRNEGYRVFLLSTPPNRVDAVATALEDQLQDFGMDVQSSAERLASYHRVENTYLSTFQALGALGLVLGTLGLGTVLLRNVLERRRELALLRATGYRRSDLIATVIAESAFLLACGLVIGVVCAAVAIAPAFVDRGQRVPVGQTLVLLAAVLVSGLLSTLLATRAVSTSALLPALRNE